MHWDDHRKEKTVPKTEESIDVILYVCVCTVQKKCVAVLCTTIDITEQPTTRREHHQQLSLSRLGV